MMKASFVLLMSLLLACPVWATIVQISGPDLTDDTYVSSNNTSTNYSSGSSSGSFRLRSVTTYETIWGLIKFELPVLNPGEYISDATMTFDYFANDNSTAGTATVNLHRILYSWNESQVTWNSRSTGTSWVNGNIGWADASGPVNYSATSLGSVSLPKGVFGLVTYQSAELTSILNQMASGALENYGFLLNTGRTYGTSSNSWYVATSNRADEVKPTLTLTILPEPMTVALLSLGGLLGLCRRK